MAFKFSLKMRVFEISSARMSIPGETAEMFRSSGYLTLVGEFNFLSENVGECDAEKLQVTITFNLL